MARFSPTDLEHPIVLAPLAGGPATLELAAAVSDAGGLGFLAAGYKTPDALRADLDAARALTARPFGVNVFAPPGPPGDPDAIARFAEALRAKGREPGEPRHHDDAFAEKVELLAAEPPAVVSFTFGCPPAELVARLQDAGAAVWITVTTPGEAAAARDAGADALVAQGVEAGGHRGGFDDAAPGELGLLALLQLLDGIGVPLVAAGGIATGRGVAAVLAAGAAAAALGTAPRGARRRRADRAHARLHRPPRAGDRQRVPG